MDGVKLYIVSEGRLEEARKEKFGIRRGRAHTHERKQISGSLFFYIIVLIRVNVLIMHYNYNSY